MCKNEGDLAVGLIPVEQSGEDYNLATRRGPYTGITMCRKDQLPAAVEAMEVPRVWLRCPRLVSFPSDAEHGGVTVVVDTQATVGGVDDSFGDATDADVRYPDGMGRWSCACAWPSRRRRGTRPPRDLAAV